MKRLIVHVGPPKTGTSVLQKWFNSNHSLLADHGILYPGHKVDANGVSSGNKDLFLTKNKKEDKLQFHEEKLEALLDSFQKSNFHTLLLSSEFFFSQIPNFVKYTTGVKLFFIAYVRPEHEFVESIYNQSVKRNKQTAPIALRQNLPLSYLDRLSEYIDDLGPEFFHLRGYGAEGFFTNGIISDFCHAIGLEEDVNNLSNEKINGSYNFECMEFKRWTNKFNLNNLDSRLDSHLQSYNQGISNYTIIPQQTYARYKEQTSAKINSINKKVSIFNFKELTNYIDTAVRQDYYHQDLHLRHVKYVSQFIGRRDPQLLEQIISLIGTQIELAYDIERFEAMEEVFKKKQSSKVHNSYIKMFREKIIGILKK